jgi:hypothetical protein
LNCDGAEITNDTSYNYLRNTMGLSNTPTITNSINITNLPGQTTLIGRYIIKY